MSAAAELVAHAVKVGLAVALLGLVARGAYRVCWPFTLYLAATLTGNTLVTTWPEQFYTHEFWALKQAVYDALKLGIVIDIAFRVCAMFPGALRVARRALLGGLVVLGVAVLQLTPPSYGDAASILTANAQWHPRVVSGTLWLYTLTAAVIVWFRLPVLGFQRAILLSFTVYLFVFTDLLKLFGYLGWEARAVMNALEAWSYLGVVCWWAYAAWTYRDEAILSEGARRRLLALSGA